MMMIAIEIPGHRSGPLFRFATLALVALLVLSACGSSGNAKEDPPSNIGLSVSSGTFTTTARLDDVTEIPFAETIVIEAKFEEPIYGSAGQTSVFAEASPSTYRIASRPLRNDSTYAFTLTNRTPGLVEISIFVSRDANPLIFSLQIGEI